MICILPEIDNFMWSEISICKIKRRSQTVINVLKRKQGNNSVELRVWNR